MAEEEKVEETAAEVAAPAEPSEAEGKPVNAAEEAEAAAPASGSDEEVNGARHELA